MAGRLGPWLGMGALALWSARPAAALLFVASLATVAGVLWGGARWRPRAWASLALLTGILAGFAAHRQVRVLTSDWSGYWASRETAVEERLTGSLEDRLQAAEGAAAALAAMASDSVPATAEPLSRLRGQYRVTALALYGPSGELLAWDGTHRGRVPEEVQRGLRRYAYGDLPLFGYLYVTAPTATGGTAMSAVLLRADLPGGLAADAGDFSSEFRAEVGEPIRLVAASPGAEAGGWDWKLGDRTLFTVILDPPTLQARRDTVLAWWRGWVAGLAFLSWLLLALGRTPGAGGGAGVSVGLLFLAAVLPFHLAPWVGGLFGTPGGWGGAFTFSLGRVAVMVLALVPLVAAAPPPRIRLSPGVGAVLAGLLVAVLTVAVRWAVPLHLLAHGQAGWAVYQGTLSVLLTLVLGLTLVAAGAGERRSGTVAWTSIPLAVLLAVGTALWVWRGGGVPLWWPLLWALPTFVAARWGVLWPGARGGLAVWVTAGVLASAAGIPEAWSHRLEARRDVAESYLARLAAADDPELEAGLAELGRVATRLAESGQGGVGLLYGAWRESGMAELGAPVWLTLWSSAGFPEEELRVGVVERPVVSYEVQDDPEPLRTARILKYDRDDARYVLRADLPGGRVFTAAAPPFTDPAFRSGLSPLLGGGTRDGDHPLTLIPVAAWEGARVALRWSRTASGWQAELPLSFANALYDAHYLVELPGTLLAVARATLLLLANLLAVLGLRAAGRGFLRRFSVRDLHWSEWVIPFRGRVTMALFGFFVLAVALFGTLAYRTMAGASWRAAQVLAERVAEDAAGWYMEVSGRMQALSRRVGVELLEYRGGELRDGSVEELVALGLYEGWVPMSVFRTLEGREDVRDVVQSELGTWGYVSAFRRLPDGDIVAAQVPRQAGASAIRSADVLELLAFAVLVGAALSLGLALLVARALTSPIQALQVASERVGAGNLALTLPANRTDEFGSVFRAFNRMVARLRRARRQLVRTTRRTKAIMEEAAVGMMALDRGGRVTLVNPRAGELLGEDVAVGEELPARGRFGEELVQWLHLFLTSERQESAVELQDGDRRIRVRARRLGGAPTKGGAVVALEDVTDELHTERVLAWGEMARQVAHEVKNPLTPMKLSVQHVRRAWDDGRPDFESILVRNADAILEEIDRLAAIAKSFSRFGAPTEGTELPLESVDVGQVVHDVLALYRGSEGPVTFEGSVPEGLPRAMARVTEMKEVLVNLLENARVASPEGSVVRVGAAAGAAGTVLLEVADAGKGIPEAIRARVFEPQFSTRSTGAGLGLAIVRRLVESWGGTVALESAAAAGTRVILHLRADGNREGKGG